MKRLALFLLLSCTPAYADKPAPAKPRRVSREAMHEYARHQLEHQILEAQKQGIQREIDAKVSRLKAIRAEWKLADDEQINTETGEIFKVVKR